ncbi:MAG: (2Fe-2S) ferredoxin domain-containing protein [Synechococcales cyanobacterium T60_A2020_003]|nr:(2Fe-2S) ferredoxin domain-containing protein [Synechococcales cyanobacterium T60_A2020_003]
MSSPLQAEAGTRQVLVCQNTSCKRAGAQAVLAAFQAHPLPDWAIAPSGCLGQCGNGPMVLVLPEGIWYCRVQPGEVRTLVECHLQGGTPVKAMLYRKFHHSA